jgi:tetratricopeptide (TPR) repeat protein
MFNMPAQSLGEKEVFASSIIRALESEEDLCISTANARASIFLAEVLTETQQYDDAITLVTKAIQRLPSYPNQSGTPSQVTLLTRAYRVLADVYEQMGNYGAAMKAIQAVASCNPAMRTKISKQVDRLRQLSAQQSS